MNRFGAFFGFLAYGFSSFLGLSADGLSSFLGLFADCLGSLLGFVSDGFRGLFCFFSNGLGGLFGLLACRFKSVLDRLSRFFCFVLYVSTAPSWPKAARAVASYNGNSKDRYFHDCPPLDLLSLYKENG